MKPVSLAVSDATPATANPGSVGDTLFVAGFIASVVVVVLVWTVVLTRRGGGRDGLRADGMLDLPIVSGSLGPRGAPLIAVASNNVNPRLAIGNGMLERRAGFTTRAVSLKTIERVSLWTYLGLTALTFTFRGEGLVFTATFAGRDKAASALRALPDFIPLDPPAADLKRSGA